MLSLRDTPVTGNFCHCVTVDDCPIKHETLSQCCFNVGSMSRACWLQIDLYQYCSAKPKSSICSLVKSADTALWLSTPEYCCTKMRNVLHSWHIFKISNRIIQETVVQSTKSHDVINFHLWYHSKHKTFV